MIKKFEFNYNSFQGSANFIVDTSKFTTEIAKKNLEFFNWEYDKYTAPINEMMKKYAIEVIRFSTVFTISEIVQKFDNYEGFLKLDGTNGIELIEVSDFDFFVDELDFSENDT